MPFVSTKKTDKLFASMLKNQKNNFTRTKNNSLSKWYVLDSLLSREYPYYSLLRLNFLFQRPVYVNQKWGSFETWGHDMNAGRIQNFPKGGSDFEEGTIRFSKREQYSSPFAWKGREKSAWKRRIFRLETGFKRNVVDSLPCRFATATTLTSTSSIFYLFDFRCTSAWSGTRCTQPSIAKCRTYCFNEGLCDGCHIDQREGVAVCRSCKWVIGSRRRDVIHVAVADWSTGVADAGMAVCAYWNS